MLMRVSGDNQKLSLPQRPFFSWKRSLQRRSLVVSFVLIFFIVASCSCRVEAQPVPDSDNWWNIEKKDFNFKNDDEETMETIVNIIVGVVVFFFVALIAFIACLCCPICVLAKMRGRRRGIVYRSAVTANNGTTVTTAQGRGGTTITISAPPRVQNATPVQSIPVASSTSTSPSVIAISNNAHKQNKPYPVQESVTVVPLITPQSHPPISYPYPPQQQQQQVPYAQQQFQQPQYETPYQYQPGQPQYGPADPPPPYPGLTRDIDNSNLPYNPYFAEGPHASAPTKE